jgi:hypothetical protein
VGILTSIELAFTQAEVMKWVTTNPLPGTQDSVPQFSTNSICVEKLTGGVEPVMPV